MSRQTFLKKTTDYAKQDELIGLSNHTKRITAVVYRGPYLDPKKNISSSVPICTGEIPSGLEIEVVLIERVLAQSTSGYVQSDKDISRPSPSIQGRANASGSTAHAMIESFPEESTPADDQTVRIGHWAYRNTYRLPKSVMGSHKIDFTKLPSPIVILDISMARSRGPKSMSHISVVAVLYKDPHDMRGTDIVPNGVSAHIKNADVGDTNSLARNMQNGIGAILNDDCHKRTIELRRKDAISNPRR